MNELQHIYRIWYRDHDREFCMAVPADSQEHARSVGVSVLNGKTITLVEDTGQEYCPGRNDWGTVACALAPLYA